MDMLSSPQFWLGLGQIIWINIILSGDNAVVIALAARGLDPRRQKQAIFWGTAAAAVLRVVLTVVAVKLMQLPWLQLIGGLLLLWIGVQLLNGGDDADDGDRASQGGLLAAIRTILVADLVMSLDNVIGVAAAANGNLTLLVVGLLIAIPIVVFGSTLMIKLMGRFPAIITLGAALIGWVGAETILSDKVIEPMVPHHSVAFYAVAALGALLVVATGKFLQRRQAANTGE